MKKTKAILTAAVLLGVASTASATTFTTSFEGLWPNTPITTQIPGFTFSADSPVDTVVAAPASDLGNAFPAHSGVSEAFSWSNLSKIMFNAPAADFSGYFTNDSAGVLSLTALDENGVPVGQAFDTGTDRNVFVNLNPGVAFSSVVIDAPGLGGDFTMDDLTAVEADSADPTVTPEPTTTALLGLGLVGMFFSTRIIECFRR